MKILRPLLLLLLLGAAAWPELARYAAERRLRAAADALRLFVAERAALANPEAAFVKVTEVALSAASGLPGDPRPFLFAGTARLEAADASRARELYREALARGERAETDLNLGRAYAALGDEASAKSAFLRGGWVSPALLGSLPPETARPIRDAVTHLEAELAAGRLRAPPALPE